MSTTDITTDDSHHFVIGSTAPTTNNPAPKFAQNWVEAGAALDELEGTKQSTDEDLTAIAGLAPANDDVIQRKAGAWTNRTIAQLKNDLGMTSIAGQFLGSAATFSGLPLTDASGSPASNGDWAVLNVDVVGTGTTSNPQYPRGIYIYNGSAFAFTVSVAAAGVNGSAVALALVLGG